MTLVENGEVFAPQRRGRMTVVLAGGRIERVARVDVRPLADAFDCERLDAEGAYVVPGLIDPHVHLLGGSGEQGFATQTPEVLATELASAGITTVVGTLGTDTTTKTMPALLAKVKALREQGLSAYAWTGGYDARPLTGSIRDDIVLIEEILGAGEIAIADRRGVRFDALSLATLASDCYVAGTLTRKAGVLHLHVGDDERRLSILRDVLDHHAVDARTIYPTHVERNEELMREAVALSRRGMFVDVDVFEEDLGRWVPFFRDEGGDLARLTASSDAAINSPRTLLEQIRECVRDRILPLDEALALATRNTAAVLKLADNGAVAEGCRANLLVLEKESLEVRHVVANGRVLVRNGEVVQREPFLAESKREIHLVGGKSHG
ncbi:MAG TPA: amidohydrolase family protein [Thermoanaerobaculia bacterium]|nr:amidohydrolase family protein [Thermoanaerobaculia bacterium]